MSDDTIGTEIEAEAVEDSTTPALHVEPAETSENAFSSAYTDSAEGQLQVSGKALGEGENSPYNTNLGPSKQQHEIEEERRRERIASTLHQISSNAEIQALQDAINRKKREIEALRRQIEIVTKEVEKNIEEFLKQRAEAQQKINDALERNKELKEKTIPAAQKAIEKRNQEIVDKFALYGIRPSDSAHFYRLRDIGEKIICVQQKVEGDGWEPPRYYPVVKGEDGKYFIIDATGKQHEVTDPENIKKIESQAKNEMFADDPAAADLVKEYMSEYELWGGALEGKSPKIRKEVLDCNNDIYRQEQTVKNAISEIATNEELILSLQKQIEQIDANIESERQRLAELQEQLKEAEEQLKQWQDDLEKLTKPEESSHDNSSSNSSNANPRNRFEQYVTPEFAEARQKYINHEISFEEMMQSAPDELRRALEHADEKIETETQDVKVVEQAQVDLKSILTQYPDGTRHELLAKEFGGFGAWSKMQAFKATNLVRGLFGMENMSLKEQLQNHIEKNPESKLAVAMNNPMSTRIDEDGNFIIKDRASGQFYRMDANGDRIPVDAATAEKLPEYKVAQDPASGKIFWLDENKTKHQINDGAAIGEMYKIANTPGAAVMWENETAYSDDFEKSRAAKQDIGEQIDNVVKDQEDEVAVAEAEKKALIESQGDEKAVESIKSTFSQASFNLRVEQNNVQIDHMNLSQLRRAIKRDDNFADQIDVDGKQVTFVDAMKDPELLDKYIDLFEKKHMDGEADYSYEVALLKELAERQSGQKTDTVITPITDIAPATTSVGTSIGSK